MLRPVLSHLCDELSFGYFIAYGYAQTAVMSVICHIAVSVVNFDQIAVTAGVISRVDYSPAIGSDDTLVP